MTAFNKNASVRSDAIVGEGIPMYSFLSPAGRRHNIRMFNLFGGGGGRNLSSSVGQGTSAVLSALAAKDIGGSLGLGSGRYIASLVMLASPLVGHAAALFTPTWNKEDFEKYKKSGVGTALLDYLVPGVAGYHRMKSIGYRASNDK